MKKHLTILFYYLTFCIIPLYSVGNHIDENVNSSEALFTGTLLAYSGTSYTPGQISIAPLFILTRENGSYNQDSHLIKNRDLLDYSLFSTLQAGIIKNIDAQVTIFGSYIEAPHGDLFTFGDTLVLIGIQLFDNNNTSKPFDLRLLIGENFPTGKRSNFDSQILGSPFLSQGTYQTLFILAAEKLFSLEPLRPFTLNINFYCTIPSSKKISGMTVFGGSKGSDGTIVPGNSYITNLALQYSLSYRWAIGCDCNYFYTNASRFRKSSINKGANTAYPSYYTLSLTPSIEYTLNDHLSMNAGAWCTFGGRNSTSFLSSYFTFYYFF